MIDDAVVLPSARKREIARRRRRRRRRRLARCTMGIDGTAVARRLFHLFVKERV